MSIICSEELGLIINGDDNQTKLSILATTTKKSYENDDDDDDGDDVAPAA
ncbi:hypothetical protein SOVF_022920 [Spinacia oleracea]|nr:hypothetical protein SOVF_022920 [Spinacia oleracea]